MIQSISSLSWLITNFNRNQLAKQLMNGEFEFVCSQGLEIKS